MALADATPFPVKGQSFRLPIAFRDSTGQVVTGWTGRAAVYCKDGASFQSTANLPTEIQATGMGYIDLTDSEMDSQSVLVKATITNGGGYQCITATQPLDLTEFTGHWLAQDPLRFEQLFMNIATVLLNKVTAANLSVTAYEYDNTTTALTATYLESDTSSDRGRFS